MLRGPADCLSERQFRTILTYLHLQHGQKGLEDRKVRRGSEEDVMQEVSSVDIAIATLVWILWKSDFAMVCGSWVSFCMRPVLDIRE